MGGREASGGAVSLDQQGKLPQQKVGGSSSAVSLDQQEVGGICVTVITSGEGRSVAWITCPSY